jgi:NADH-quinone oxidoreductase subunit C
MADETHAHPDDGRTPVSEPANSAFDAVEQGPRASDEPTLEVASVPAEVPSHPSVAALRARFGEAIGAHQLHAGDEHVVFVDSAHLFGILEFLQQEPDHHYAFLLDLTAVDYGGGKPIQVVYQLWSMTHHRSLRVKTELPLDALSVASVVPLWKTADWLEREVWDLFGVTFEGHPDPRRILMPDNYAEGHPLRKDFPLRGRFSRAEQTRRALGLQVEDHYTDLEMMLGRDPQLVAEESDGSLPGDMPGSDTHVEREE